MAMVYSVRPDYQGLLCPRIDASSPKLPSRVYFQNWSTFKSPNSMQVPFGRSPNPKVQHFLGKKYNSPGAGNHHHLTVDDDYDQEPFWLNWTKEAFWAMKSLLIFLVEQPSQLRQIEWPSFQSTLKTATLSLILVGLLIIALSSVDSALCYILSLLLSRRA